jgi:hypothetical protein
VAAETETSVHTRSTRRHIPEDGILHSHRRENLKSYILLNGLSDLTQVISFLHTPTLLTLKPLHIFHRARVNSDCFHKPSPLMDLLYIFCDAESEILNLIYLEVTHPVVTIIPSSSKRWLSM